MSALVGSPTALLQTQPLTPDSIMLRTASHFALAARLQAQPLTPDSILLREATYRAVGEVFPHLREQVDFGGWYDSELRHMLQSAELTGASQEGGLQSGVGWGGARVEWVWWSGLGWWFWKIRGSILIGARGGA